MNSGVGIYAGFQVFHFFIAFKIDVLVFETSPKTLNSDVVQSHLFSVHTDLDVVIDKNFDKNIRCNILCKWYPLNKPDSDERRTLLQFPESQILLVMLQV